MNFKQIITALQSSQVSKHQFADDNTKSFLGLGNAPIVEKVGGKKGDGSLFLVVRYFDAHNVYVALQGAYDPYSGIDFTGKEYSEVEPKTVSKTIFNIKAPVKYNSVEIIGQVLSLVKVPDFARLTPHAKAVLQSRLGEIKEVERIGEKEEDGNLWYAVYLFVDHGVYIRIDGKNTFAGILFDTNRIYEVKPVDRTVTFYEAV